jgi:hypothetical protein
MDNEYYGITENELRESWGTRLKSSSERIAAMCVCLRAGETWMVDYPDWSVVVDREQGAANINMRGNESETVFEFSVMYSSYSKPEEMFREIVSLIYVNLARLA